MNSDSDLKLLGAQATISDFTELPHTSDKRCTYGKHGVLGILATKDGKVEFAIFENHALAPVHSAMAILPAFQILGLGDPRKFYDAIITAGYPMRGGEPGTLGELSPKPHPWLYAEVSRLGLGITFEQCGHVICIEDSGAGVISIRLAGFSVIGFAGGNIAESCTKGLCAAYCENFEDVLGFINH